MSPTTLSWDQLFRPILNSLRSRQGRPGLTGLHGSTTGFSLTFLARELPDSSWLIVTATDEAAERLHEDLRFFHAMLGLSPEALALFPEWETLPYESTPPHVELIASRMRTLRADLVTAVTRAYYPDEMRMPGGVAVRYVYTKDAATLPNGHGYDAALYPAAITWAFLSGSVVGAAGGVVHPVVTHVLVHAVERGAFVGELAGAERIGEALHRIAAGILRGHHAHVVAVLADAIGLARHRQVGGEAGGEDVGVGHPAGDLDLVEELDEIERAEKRVRGQAIEIGAELRRAIQVVHTGLPHGAIAAGQAAAIDVRLQPVLLAVRAADELPDHRPIPAHAPPPIDR